MQTQPFTDKGYGVTSLKSHADGIKHQQLKRAAQSHSTHFTFNKSAFTIGKTFPQISQTASPMIVASDSNGTVQRKKTNTEIR